jgi:hypothetical protein
MTSNTHQTAPTQFVEAKSIRFAYRRFGKADGVLAEHWDVLQDEATGAESKSGLPMFGTQFRE